MVGEQTLLCAPAGGFLLLDVVSGDIGIQCGAYRVGLAGSRPQDVCQLLTGGGDKAARQGVVQVQGRVIPSINCSLRLGRKVLNFWL